MSTKKKNPRLHIEAHLHNAEMHSGVRILPEGKAGVLPILFSQVYANLRQAIESKFSPYGISEAQARVLSKISMHEDGCRLSQLAKEIMPSTKQNLASLATRLISSGLVIQAADPDDMRAKRYWITDQGKELLNETLPKHRQMLTDVFASLSEEEIDSLTMILGKLDNRILSL